MDAAPPGAESPADIPAGLPDATGADVLIVDDNEQNLELLQAYLEGMGCEVRTARDGLEAVAAIESRPPELVLLDVMMPRMSGFQVCERVKRQQETAWVPVIMVTALSEVGDVERAVEAGADDFLTKPVNKLELTVRVRSLLRVGRLQRELQRTRAAARRATRE